MTFLKGFKFTAISLLIVGSVAVPMGANAKNPFNNTQVQQIILNNFSTTQTQLRNQISSYLGTGQISQAQANSFMAQLDQIAASTPTAAANPYQTQALVGQFNTIGQQINASIAAPNTFQYTNVPYNAFTTRNGVNGVWSNRFYNNRDWRYRHKVTKKYYPKHSWDGRIY